jgi:tetratricopeptide (TPR) repeat protein
MDAQVAVAIGDKSKAAQLLAQAVAGRPVRDLQAQEALDLALLAGEAGAADIAKSATTRLKAALTALPKTAGDHLPLQMAEQALAGEVTAAAQQAIAGGDALDVVPLVRTLTALRRFELAAKVLDATAIKQPSPRRDLLKLRFGLASAMNDAEGEIRIGRLFIQLDPDLPEGYDILSAGLARNYRYREAIEVLYDLSKRNPERDIVLGRLAGLLNFLTEQAGRDPARAKDLEAVIAKMQLAATDSKDVVARFIVATRAYYAGKLEEALPLLESLLDSGNRDPRIPLYTAMAHFWLGHQEQAERLIARAVEIGPSDPDVFYCRSQIVRRKHLPQAIADLERYEQMTLQPWATGPTSKAQRVSAELKLMRLGRLPPDWDKPGPDRAVYLPAEQTGTELPADVREGKLPLLALDPSATALPDASSLATAMAAAGSATTGAVLTAPDPSGLPVTALPPAQESSSQRWFPAALLAALAAAMGIRLWLKPSSKPKDGDPGQS